MTCFDSSKGKESLGILLPGLIRYAWVASHEAAPFNVLARRLEGKKFQKLKLQDYLQKIQLIQNQF